MARQQGKPKKLRTHSANAAPIPQGTQSRDFPCDFDMHAALELYPPGGDGRHEHNGNRNGYNGQKAKTSCDKKPSEPDFDYEALLRHYPPKSRDMEQKDAAELTAPISKHKGASSHQFRKKLKRRNIDATIDLHGLLQKDARERLEHFFENAQSCGLRKICIVHGKGHHSSEGRGVLQGLVWNFLQIAKTENKVLEFHHPAERYGGRGATVALLNRNGKYKA